MPPRWLLEIHCRIKREKRREFRLNISILLQDSKSPASSSSVYEDQNEPGNMLIVEEWQDRQQLDVYLASDEFLSMLGGFRVLGEVHDYRVVDLKADSDLPSCPVQAPRSLRGQRSWRTSPDEDST